MPWKNLSLSKNSREAETFIRKKFAIRRQTASPDKAIILTLLDSAIRASEFCALRLLILMRSEASWKSANVPWVGKR